MGTRAIQTLLLLLPLLAACSGHGTLSEEPDVAQADSLVTLTFRFTIPYTLVPETRNEWTDASGTTWNDGDSEATKWENYIDIPNNDFRFYVINNNNHWIKFNLSPDTEGVESVVLNHLDSPTSYVYEVRTRLMPDILTDIKDNNFNITMEANWYHGNLKDDGTFDAGRNSYPNGYPVNFGSISVSNTLTQKTFTWNHKPLSESHTIPMHGAVTVQGGAGYTPGGFFDCGTLYLIRSLAKIEICLSDKVKAKGYTIEGCSLINYNTTGYYTPYNEGFWYGSDYIWLWVADTYRLYYDQNGGTLNDKSSKCGDTDSALFELSPDHDKAYIYTPEIQNDPNESNCIDIAIKNLQLKLPKEDGSTKIESFWEEGMKLSEIHGDFKKLHRNRIYRIEITDVSGRGDIDYTVCHWRYETAGDITFN